MLSSSFYRILIVLFCFFSPVEVWSYPLPTKPVEVRIDKTVTVSGDSVLLGDVATIYAKSIRDFQALSGLMLSKIDESGELKLPRAYLMARIKEALPAGTDFELSAPAEVRFHLNRIGISTDEFVAEITKRGQAEGKFPEWAEVEVEPVGGFNKLKLWKISESRIEPAAVMPRWKGDLAFKISRPGKDLVWVKVKVRWFANVWVAKRSLRIFSKMRASDFKKARVDVTTLREDPVLASEDITKVLEHARMKRSIASGAPLVSTALERAPDAKPGQNLKVIFVSESGIRVSTEGSLLGSGSIGQDVRVKLRRSRKVVTGKLVADNLMEVSL